MQFEKFNFTSLEALKQKIHSMQLALPLSENMGILKKPLQIQHKTIANRLCIQPMEGCDGTREGRPDTLTLRRYDRFAKGGAGLIWFEAVAVAPEARANPRQLHINEKTLDSFKSIVESIKETCLKENGFLPLIIMQATHSGRYSKPAGKPQPIIAYHNPNFEKTFFEDSCIVADERLQELESIFGNAAHLAEEAGFDGVDVKACHGYLNCELLSAFTRKGAYGGSFENRTRFYTNAVRAAKANTSGDFIVTSRLNIYDGYEYPYGFGVNEKDGLKPDMTEPAKLINILHQELDMQLINITMGNPYTNPHVNRPFDKGFYAPPEHPLEGVCRMYENIALIQKQFPALNIISSAPTYLRQFSANLAAGAVESGCCGMVGFGRQGFAYPEFAVDLLKNGGLKPEKCCITCGKCTELMRAGSTAGCPIRDGETYMPIYKKDVLNN